MLLDGIVNNSSAVIYVKDTDGKYLMTNVRFNEIFHKNKQDMIGKNQFDLFPEQLARNLQCHDDMVLESALISHFEESVYYDDSYHVYLSIKFPLFDSDGSVYAVAGIATDITDYKQLEQELQENNSRLNALINASPDIICFKDGEGNGCWQMRRICNYFSLQELIIKGKQMLNWPSTAHFTMMPFWAVWRPMKKRGKG